VGVRKFLPSGNSAGGDTPVVATDSTNDLVYQQNGAGEQGDIGASGSLFSVAYASNVSAGAPQLSFLDVQGNPVGRPVVAGSAVVPRWVTVAGTSQGFVYLYDNATSVAESFIASSAADAGAPDGGDAGAVPSFVFPGANRAISARAISDSPGGAGGVGVAILYTTGLSLAYVKADGVMHQGPSMVITETSDGSFVMAVTSFGGSFGLSLYNSTAQSTQMAASGCMR
jgi:hypothetical protein